MLFVLSPWLIFPDQRDGCCFELLESFRGFRTIGYLRYFVTFFAGEHLNARKALKKAVF